MSWKSVAGDRLTGDDGYEAVGVSPHVPEFPAALIVVPCPFPEPARDQMSFALSS
jgi:hypothetical protein